MSSESVKASNPQPALARVLGVPDAILLGLGSIVGTGVFVSLGIASEIAGAWVCVAVVGAALVATFNGMSSAQLAADHPVSGGTYEYGYRYLTPTLGFAAGWMFLCAKSASAATAALGFSGYVLASLGVEGKLPRVALALGLVSLLTWIVARGIRRSNRANTWIVSITLLGLVTFLIAGLQNLGVNSAATAEFFEPLREAPRARDLLHGTALMFVAFTGYGRIATMGEEIQAPARNIPRAILWTLSITALLYVAIALVCVGTVGAPALAQATGSRAAPLQSVAERFVWNGSGSFTLSGVVSLAAMTAMAGVLLNLLLGLSRVLLAMARRADMPRALAVVDHNQSPQRSVYAIGLLISVLVTTGSVRATWSFSAFTVLVYYALTNLAALRLAPAARLYPRILSWLGLFSCLGLSVWIDSRAWGAGIALLLIGLVLHRLSKLRAPTTSA